MPENKSARTAEHRSSLYPTPSQGRWSESSTFMVYMIHSAGLCAGRWLAIATMAALPLPLHGQQSGPSAASQFPYTINVNVNEVLLHATVRTRGGTAVT